MKHLTSPPLILGALILAACSGEVKSPAPETRVGLTGDWQSLEDANYVLKFNMETYREFYENEEVSRDQWQPVKSCDDPQPVEKTDPKYASFQIWAKESDSRICYAISNWTADEVSLTYAGTTVSYKRAN